MTDHPARRRPWRRILLAVVALTAPTAVLTGGVSPAPAAPAATASAAEGEPPFTLEVPRRYVAYGDGGRVWDDLGIALVAGEHPFELWLQRPPAYDTRVKVTWKSPDGDVRLRVPSGRLERLKRFITLEFDPLKAGADSFTVRRNGCLGGETVRVRPDAPARSPYPLWCGGANSPFALGAVQGIEAGYASSPFGGEGSQLEIPRGRYDLTVSISDKWAAALGLDETQRTARQRLVVKDYSESEGELRQRPGAERASDDPRPAASEPARSALVDPDELPDDIPLPDLRSLPAFGFEISGNGNFLAFSATVWNGGDSPLVVDGFRRSGEDYMDAYQYFFDQDGRQLDEYVPVGGFEWDPKPTHQHWHFQSFARYTLVEEGHEPHPEEPGDHHVKSRKEAFCLVPTDSVDMTVLGADWHAEEADLNTSCGDYGSRAIREVLPSGWGDTYAQFRAGQSFNLKDLPRRTCVDILVEGNPTLGTSDERILVERDYSNNASSRTVCIAGRDGNRRITYVAPVGIVDPGYGEHP